MCYGETKAIRLNEKLNMTMRRRLPWFHDGFTRIQLIVSILVISLLATIVTLKLRSVSRRANRIKAESDIAQLRDALDHYFLDNGCYPTTDQGLAGLIAAPTTGKVPKGWGGPYIKKIPLDPWGNKYFYQNEGNSYILKSLGSGGTAGGRAKAPG